MESKKLIRVYEINEIKNRERDEVKLKRLESIPVKETYSNSPLLPLITGRIAIKSVKQTTVQTMPEYVSLNRIGTDSALPLEIVQATNSGSNFKKSVKGIYLDPNESVGKRLKKQKLELERKKGYCL